MKSFVIIIPLKSNSTRIQNKNTKLLNGKPLCMYIVETIMQSELLKGHLWIDTDSHEIINLIQSYGYTINYFIRDPKLSDNSTDGNKLLENEILNIPGKDLYFQLLCTSPFLKLQTIETCVNLLLNSEGNQSIVCCNSKQLYLWKNGKPEYDVRNIPNSNTLEKTCIEAMSFYGISALDFQLCKHRLGTDPIIYEIDDEEAIDINTIEDFKLAEKIALANHLYNQQYFKNVKNFLNTCLVHDVCQEHNIQVLLLDGFKSTKETIIFGKVKPLQVRPLKDNERKEGIYDCLKSYDSITYNNVIFVNNMVNGKAYFGDLNCSIAETKGCQGVIVNGYSRDIDRLKMKTINVFYKNNICDDVLGAGTLDFYNEPIVINNRTIMVDDYAIADTDGVIIISKHDIYFVIKKSIEKYKLEQNIFIDICEQIDVNEILQNHGEF